MSIIKQVNVGGTNYPIKGSSVTSIFYGTCSTAAATTAKVVDCSDFTSSDLVAGVMIIVKNTTANSGAVASLTMNVNSTGAKPIKKIYNGAVSNLSSVGELGAGAIILFIYDGTNWVAQGLDYNTDTNTKVIQNAAITTNGNYPVILATSTATTSQTNTVNKTELLTYNPSTKLLQTGALGVTAGVGYTTVVPTTTTGYTDGQVMFVLMDEE